MKSLIEQFKNLLEDFPTIFAGLILVVKLSNSSHSYAIKSMASHFEKEIGPSDKSTLRDWRCKIDLNAWTVIFGMISNEVSSSFYSLESIALSAERKELEARRGREKTRKEEGPTTNYQEVIMMLELEDL